MDAVVAGGDAGGAYGGVPRPKRPTFLAMLARAAADGLRKKSQLIFECLECYEPSKTQVYSSFFSQGQSLCTACTFDGLAETDGCRAAALPSTTL